VLDQISLVSTIRTVAGSHQAVARAFGQDETTQRAIQGDASMLEEIVNVDLTEDLRKKIKASDELYAKLIDEIGILQYKIKKQDKRFKQIFSS